MSDSGCQNRTADELLIARVDDWLMHVRTCQVEDCADCEVHFNQVNLAHNVWMRSAHRKPLAAIRAAASEAPPPQQELK